MGQGLNRSEDTASSADACLRWVGQRVTVAGIGVAGFAAANALLARGASVTVCDQAAGDQQCDRAGVLEILGAQVRLGQPLTVGDEVDLLVVSPGLPPSAPVIRHALARSVPVWGELELAWQLRGEAAAPWLLVTGTNGKTTTTLMLASILAAAGRRTAAVGNIGDSLVEAVTSGTNFDVLAVEVGAPQLPFVHSLSPLAAVCLNVAPDHIDHFGSFYDYAAAKARIYERVERARVYNVDDPATERMVEEAETARLGLARGSGARAIGFTLGIPRRSMLGIVDEVLVDRAFVSNSSTPATELATVADVHPSAPHNVANALAAAALARAYGVPAAAVGEGLRAFEPAGHRIATVATVAGVDYVDDSKATNCHAAQTSIKAFNSVVWIAGGLAKGQEFDELVKSAVARLQGVVLLGRDRGVIREALARHAPQVPMIEVARADTGAMVEVVRHAAELARPGDTVLLAPGCASWDMFRDYAARGDAFAEAVQELRRGWPIR